MRISREYCELKTYENENATSKRFWIQCDLEESRGKTGAKFELMASSQPIYAIVGLF